MSAQQETQEQPQLTLLTNKRQAEEDLESLHAKKPKRPEDVESDAEEKEEEDVFDRLEKLRYRPYCLLKFHSKFLPCLLKNLKTLSEYQCSEYRGDYQDAAFKFHKKLDSYLLDEKCIEDIRFESNQDMEEKMKELESTCRITENHSPVELTIYRPPTSEDVFMIKYNRAIHSEYYDEDEQGGQAEYDSDGYVQWRDGDTDSDDGSDDGSDEDEESHADE